MQKRNYFKFIFAGLLVVLAGEFQINILILHKGIQEYIGALVMYVVFLSLMYVLNQLLIRKISQKRVDVVYYLTGGFLGLTIEWFIIGNGPWVHNGAIQAGMFAWWTAVVLIPRIFTTASDFIIKSAKRRVSILLLIYSLVSTFIVLVSPSNLRPAISGIMIAIVYIIINFQFIPYLVRNGFSRTFVRSFMWFLVVAAIVNLFI